MRHRNQNPPAAGFTIVELMVVVSLIALLIGASVPLIFKIDQLSRDRTGINSFAVSVTAARAYATRRIADKDTPAQAENSGSAVLVTPMNELRIIEDVQDETLETGQLSGYWNVDKIDFISMPRGVGVVGINRSASGVKLLAPPFVIRFNRHGQLIASSSLNAAADWGTFAPEKKRDFAIYGTDNATFPQTVRSDTYDPKAWDPDLNDIGAKWNGTQYGLPFQVMEAVIGVITYSKADFEDAGGAFPTTQPSLGCRDGACAGGAPGILEWMLDNGNVMFFSRNSGNILRVNRP